MYNLPHDVQASPYYTCIIILASFPGLPIVQFLIAHTVQKTQREKAWEHLKGPVEKGENRFW